MKSLTKKEILLNRPPLKQLIDAAATAKVVIKGDIYEKRPLGLRERLNCVKFYFDAAGVHRLHAMLPRTRLALVGAGAGVVNQLGAGRRRRIHLHR